MVLLVLLAIAVVNAVDVLYTVTSQTLRPRAAALLRNGTCWVQVIVQSVTGYRNSGLTALLMEYELWIYLVIVSARG